MKAVFSEILNYFSHSDKEITIYLKENTNVYLEDELNYLLNMTSVTITSYSEVTTTAERATLIGTRIAQPGINTNASFSILQNTDIRLSAKISEGTLTAEEIAVIGSSIVTVTVVRTSLFLNNIDCIREVVDYEYSSTFFHFVYLQDKWFDSRKSIL